MHASSITMSNEQLVSKLATTWRNESALMAETIALLIEIEKERVHLELASPSMFEFCMRHFGMSEGEAFRRTAVARVAVKFPSVLAALREKRVHLTTLAKMRKLFTQENVDELLIAVAGKRKRQVDEVIARYAPKPDVPARIRKLPGRRVAAVTPVSPVPIVAREERGDARREPPTTASGAPRLTPASERTLDLFASPPKPATVTPLAESRYAVQFTASAELRDVIEEAQSLMRHRHPDGDLAAIALEAFSDLVAKLKKAKFAALSKKPKCSAAPARESTSADVAIGAGPLAGAQADAVASADAVTSADALAANSAGADAASGTAASAGGAAVRAEWGVVGGAANRTAGAGARKRRHIPNSVKREVVARDGLRCTYMSAHGEQCSARELLELDHRHPRALGGGDEASNLRVLCRAHNHYAAEIVFSREHIRRAIDQRKRERRE